MYSNIMVALDNSSSSMHAMELAIGLARPCGARLTGNHVYAARLHDERFRQLEPGLPARFQESDGLLRLRGIHGELIGRGLEIISESYLNVFEERCRESGVEWARKTPEGRHYQELVRDTRESGYDLVVLGAHGLGRVDRSVLGSVCERVSRQVECDLMVVHNGVSPAAGRLLVGIDGSDHSFAALRAALDISRLHGSEVAAVAAYDPFFHSVAFNSIAGVLSQEASRLFRFKEQETLHDEIIDTGLESVYRSHLERARQIAAEQGIALETEILEGKPFDAIASYSAKWQPALLVVGRVGIHHVDGATLGSTAENLMRIGGCNLLVVNSGARGDGPGKSAEHELPTDAPVSWNPEAEQRLERVPRFLRRMVRGRIESFARERGEVSVTLELYDRARRHFGM